jgi:hypothetical protein
LSGKNISACWPPLLAGKGASGRTTNDSTSSNDATAGVPRYTASRKNQASRPRTSHATFAITSPKRKNMDILVSYEHSLASAPEEFIVHVPSQLVNNVPANVPRALLPEYIANLIVERSPSIGKIRNLRIL